MTVSEVAADIGPGLAKATLAGEVNGALMSDAVSGCAQGSILAIGGG